MTTNQNPIAEASPVLNVTQAAIGEAVSINEPVASTEFSTKAMPALDSLAPDNPLPVAATPMTKQEKRCHLFRMFDPLRYKIESFATAAVNARCGTRHKGTFEVRFDNPNEVTEKTLAGFCMTGAVHFTAEDIGQHPALKKIRKAEGGVNLSALMTRAKRPANIDDAAWCELDEMWKDVSAVLRINGITPMHSIVMNALVSAGIGGPKINKKLGGGINTNAADTHDAMLSVLRGLETALQTIEMPS